MITTRVRLDPHTPGGYVLGAAFLPGRLLTTCLGDIPTQSPYRAGDWVTCHGYPGDPNGPQRWGWRGYVLGGRGGTLLCGLTDDGQEWAETWGRLVVDGDPCPDGLCLCHPRPQRPAQQLGLF